MTDAAGGWTKGAMGPWIACHDALICVGADRIQKWCVRIGNKKGPLVAVMLTSEVAHLLAEAFNVATETGLSPRQLAEQRAELKGAIEHADGCFEAALAEGWLEALAEGDIERIRDLWQRRLIFAREAFPWRPRTHHPPGCEGGRVMTTSRAPQTVSATDWYYEYSTYLLIVHEVRDTAGIHIQTDQFKLPWKMIENFRVRRVKKRKTASANKT